MIGRHIGRLGHHGFLLRLETPGAQMTEQDVPKGYWEVEYEGRIYPWRPVHAEDEGDLPRLMRTAMAYLRQELHRYG